VRLVLDTCVIVSAFRSLNGASRKLIDMFDSGRYEILLSTALLLEYEVVLTRPEHMQVHNFSIAEISEILDTIAARATHISFYYYDWKPQLLDPEDELVLAAAINGHADAIVTYNTSDFLPAAPLFGIQVLTPGRIIKERFRV
jgi:putative PIN family toxin of toxin-antitoxin system